MPIISSTLSSSEQTKKVVLPAIRNPPVEASFVAENPPFVKAEDTEWESSLFIIAYISFIFLPFSHSYFYRIAFLPISDKSICNFSVVYRNSDYIIVYHIFFRL